MLSLRISVPEGLTDDVVAVLPTPRCVTGLSVLRGASLIPPGDVVTADVAREGANPVIDALRDLGVHREGTVRVDPVDTWLSHAAFEAERQAPGASADAVVWTQVGNRAYEDSELNWTYLSFMVLATLIAGVAIVAGLLDPRHRGHGARAGVRPDRRHRGGPGAPARPPAGDRDPHAACSGSRPASSRRSSRGCSARALGWVTYEDIVGPRPRDGVHLRPNRWTLVVAVIAAAAGVLSLTSARTGGLSGVFISVTTVPAAGNIALGLAFGAWHEVWGSAAAAGAQPGRRWRRRVGHPGAAAAGWARVPARRRTVIGGRTVIGRPPD